MVLELSTPLIITPRLLPGICISDATVSVEAIGIVDGHVRWNIFIDRPGMPEYADPDSLGSGRGQLPDSAGTRSAIASVLSFLSAEAEGYRCTMGVSEPVDGWIFNADIAEWAYLNEDEIAITQCDLESDNWG